MFCFFLLPYEPQCRQIYLINFPLFTLMIYLKTLLTLNLTNNNYNIIFFQIFIFNMKLHGLSICFLIISISILFGGFFCIIFLLYYWQHCALYQKQLIPDTIEFAMTSLSHDFCSCFFQIIYPSKNFSHVWPPMSTMLVTNNR